MWVQFFHVMVLVTISSGAKILIMMPNPAPSFTRSFQPLFRELALRGHEVMAYTTVPLPPPIPHNYKEVIVDNVFVTSPRMVNYLKDIKDRSQSGLTAYALFLWEFGLIVSEEILKISAIKDLISSNDFYDLIIDSPLILQEAVAGFRHKFKCPAVNLFPNSPNQMFSEITGNPQPYAYIPYHNLAYTSSMDLWQRINNVYMGLITHLGNQLYYLPQQESIMRRHFNDTSMPSLPNLLRHAHVSLLDTHLLLDYPRPYLPGTVLVGGMTSPASNSLPEELKDWLDKAEEGVVYFSLGSVMRFNALSPTSRAAILNTLKQIKQRVLLKWEESNTDKLPQNIRAETWVSQADVLAHANCHLFVSHGGIHSMMEALHHGVPVVGLPVFGDQVHNLVNLQNLGVATYVLHDQLTEQTFSSAIHQVLQNKTFQENALRLSAIVKDQLMLPLDRAVYWVEYTLRHKGAHHLSSAVTDLSWYQQYLLDIILFTAACFCLFCFTVKYILKLILHSGFWKIKTD